MRLGPGAELRVALHWMRTGRNFVGGGVGGMDMGVGVSLDLRLGFGFKLGFGGLVLVPALTSLAGAEVAVEVNGICHSPNKSIPLSSRPPHRVRIIFLLCSARETMYLPSLSQFGTSLNSFLMNTQDSKGEQEQGGGYTHRVFRGTPYSLDPIQQSPHKL